MKKLMIILIVTALSLGASAQKRYYSRGGYGTSHVVVGTPYYYSPYWYYDPFYYPYYYPNRYYPRESKLEMKIEDIKQDYRDKIWSARHDKTVSKAKRKEIVHQLKHERDEAILQAKEDYYKSR